MGIAAAALRRFYHVHGVGIEVSSSEPDALAALDLRLCAFGAVPPGDGGTAVTITLRREADAGLSDAELGRPIYDTPFGTLHYLPDSDSIGGRLAGVSLHCRASDGTCLITGDSLAGRELYLATHPLATIALMELLERRGLYSLHAGCVAPRDGRGVLIAGSSGAGKSTLTLALARAGVPFLSDDVVFLRPLPGEGRIEALGFADTIGVTGYAAERFPDLRDRLARVPLADGFPKRLGRIEQLFDTAVLPACVPGAVVFPEVAPGAASAISPLAPGEALLRLVPDVLLTDPDATQAHLAAVAALLRQVDCYSLRSGIDVERAAELVAGLV